MACDASTLAADALCVAAGLSNHQLLAYIAWQLATNASLEPTSANLAALGKCLAAGMSDHQLLASIAYSQCVLAGG